jgi:hypothetical protein
VAREMQALRFIDKPVEVDARIEIQRVHAPAL